MLKAGAKRYREVGDGHISAMKEGKDNITFPERRVVSLNKKTEEL